MVQDSEIKFYSYSFKLLATTLYILHCADAEEETETFELLASIFH